MGLINSQRSITPKKFLDTIYRRFQNHEEKREEKLKALKEEITEQNRVERWEPSKAKWPERLKNEPPIHERLDQIIWERVTKRSIALKTKKRQEFRDEVRECSFSPAIALSSRRPNTARHREDNGEEGAVAIEKVVEEVKESDTSRRKEMPLEERLISWGHNRDRKQAKKKLRKEQSLLEEVKGPKKSGRTMSEEYMKRLTKRLYSQQEVKLRKREELQNEYYEQFFQPNIGKKIKQKALKKLEKIKKRKKKLKRKKKKSGKSRKRATGSKSKARKANKETKTSQVRQGSFANLRTPSKDENTFIGDISLKKRDMDPNGTCTYDSSASQKRLEFSSQFSSELKFKKRNLVFRIGPNDSKDTLRSPSKDSVSGQYKKIKNAPSQLKSETLANKGGLPAPRSRGGSPIKHSRRPASQAGKEIQRSPKLQKSPETENYGNQHKRSRNNSKNKYVVVGVLSKGRRSPSGSPYSRSKRSQNKGAERSRASGQRPSAPSQDIQNEEKAVKYIRNSRHSVGAPGATRETRKEGNNKVDSLAALKAQTRRRKSPASSRVVNKSLRQSSQIEGKITELENEIYNCGKRVASGKIRGGSRVKRPGSAARKRSENKSTTKKKASLGAVGADSTAFKKRKRKKNLSEGGQNQRPGGENNLRVAQDSRGGRPESRNKNMGKSRIITIPRARKRTPKRSSAAQTPETQSPTRSISREANSVSRKAKGNNKRPGRPRKFKEDEDVLGGHPNLQKTLKKSDSRSIQPAVEVSLNVGNNHSFKATLDAGNSLIDNSKYSGGLFKEDAVNITFKRQDYDSRSRSKSRESGEVDYLGVAENDHREPKRAQNRTRSRPKASGAPILKIARRKAHTRKGSKRVSRKASRSALH